MICWLIIICGLGSIFFERDYVKSIPSIPLCTKNSKIFNNYYLDTFFTFLKEFWFGFPRTLFCISLTITYQRIHSINIRLCLLYISVSILFCEKNDVIADYRYLHNIMDLVYFYTFYNLKIWKQLLVKYMVSYLIVGRK